MAASQLLFAGWTRTGYPAVAYRPRRAFGPHLAPSASSVQYTNGHSLITVTFQRTHGSPIPEHTRRFRSLLRIVVVGEESFSVGERDELISFLEKYHVK